MNITKTFPVTGMHCAGCSGLLTKKISKVPGVIEAKVTYTTEKAKITYDEDSIDWKAVEKAVSSVGGYKIIVDQSNVNEASENSMGGEDHHDHAAMMKKEELNQLKQKLIISGILSIPLLVSMFMAIPHEIAFIITSIILFYSGSEFFKNAWMGLKGGNTNMDTLIALGTASAYLYSTVVTFWPEVFGDEGAVYFETAAVIITLILLGRYLEARAKGKAGEAIKSLMRLQAKKARIIRDGNEVEVDLDEVRVRDHIIVKPGEKVPVDGKVIEGESYVDESLVTGESKPVKKQSGDGVIGSTINSKGKLVVEATQVGEGTMLSKIIQMVEEAQGSQAPIQKLADQVSAIFVPAVIGIAIVAFFVWYFLIGVSFTSALVVFITVLIISCPCALGLATPISIMVGTGRGAQKGILIKNAEKLQIAGNIQVIALDKTGTLTQGNFAVTDVVSADITPTWKEKEIVKVSAALEMGSEHPIATSIIEKAKNLKIKFPKVDQFKAVEGKGLTGKVDSKSIVVGTSSFIEEEKHIRCAVLDEKVDKLKSQGKTIAYVSVDKKTVGAIALADELKPKAKQLIKHLNQLNIDAWMITGDNKETGKAVAKRLGITNVMAEVLPDQKADKVKELQNKYAVVAMAGDGVNDAPALAQANVGIAMATGTDVAMETADITLVRGNVELIAEAISLSKKTMNNIKQNLFWAFGYNTILIPIAAGVLIPWGFQINPMLASGAMAFSSVSVVMNALRLKRA